MLIRRLTVTPIAFADPPLLNAAGIHEPLALRTILQLELEDGTVGLGEGWGEKVCVDGVRKVAAALPGFSVFDTSRLRTLVDRTLSGDPAYSPRVCSAIASMVEVAFLDAQGKMLGVPVCDLLGGAVRDRVEFAGYLFYKWAGHPAADGTMEPDEWGAALDPEQMVAQAQRMIDLYGFRSLKVKAGVLPPAVEIDTMRALREAFPQHPLRIDPNGAWSLETALAAAEELEGVLEYLEDPVLGQEAMGQVAARTSTPLATNMCVTAFDEIPTGVARGSVQIVLGDHHFWGGLRATRDLGAICSTFGLRMSMHSNSHLGISLQAMTHVAAAVPALDYACDTHYPWNRGSEIVVGGPRAIVDGAIEVTKDPGLGVELDQDALARAHELYVSSGRTVRDDATYQSAWDPSFSPTMPRF